MTIDQRVPWTVQPQVPVPLDSGGLFGRRIAASYSFQFGRALRVDQQYRQITHTGKSVPVVSKYKGLSNASGGNGWSDTDDGFRVKAASSGLTVAFGFSQASIVGSCRILSNDGTGYNWWIQRGGSGNLEVFVNSALQATAAWPSSATAYHFWSVSMAAGGGTTIYLDGVLVGSGGSTPLTSVDRSLSWLADGSQIGAFYSTDLLYGVLSAQEHNAFCANPWQIYAPLPRHIWAAAAAGPPPTFIPSWAYRKTRTIGAGVI